jgi:hypothetical protein
MAPKIKKKTHTSGITAWKFNRQHCLVIFLVTNMSLQKKKVKWIMISFDLSGLSLQNNLRKKLFNLRNTGL